MLQSLKMRSRKLEALKESGPVASLAAPVDPAPLARPVATPARSEKPQRKQREVFSDAQPRSILFGSKNTPKIQTRLWRHGTPEPEHPRASLPKLSQAAEPTHSASQPKRRTAGEPRPPSPKQHKHSKVRGPKHSAEPQHPEHSATEPEHSTEPQHPQHSATEPEHSTEPQHPQHSATEPEHSTEPCFDDGDHHVMNRLCEITR